MNNVYKSDPCVGRPGESCRKNRNCEYPDCKKTACPKCNGERTVYWVGERWVQVSENSTIRAYQGTEVCPECGGTGFKLN